MFCMILKQNINKNIIKNINIKTIHNHSYIVLKKELDKKEDQIKKLKEDNKELEYKNNRLLSIINRLESQKSIDMLSYLSKFKLKS
jgi:predicted RNase H-like nuclease (RuvC/YqgF family)